MHILANCIQAVAVVIIMILCFIAGYEAGKTIPLRTTNAVNTPSLWSISTANKLRHSLGFPSYPFSGKIPLASARGIFLANNAELWYNGIANNPSWRFSNSKALADKTAGVFFYFFRGLKNGNRGVP